MSKVTRGRRPTPHAPPARIQLTPRECTDLQGVCAVAALALLQIRAQGEQQIAEAQKPQQQMLARLAKKYRTQGMRLDVNYQLDMAAHALVVVEAPKA